MDFLALYCLLNRIAAYISKPSTDMIHLSAPTLLGQVNSVHNQAVSVPCLPPCQHCVSPDNMDLQVSKCFFTSY